MMGYVARFVRQCAASILDPVIPADIPAVSYAVRHIFSSENIRDGGHLWTSVLCCTVFLYSTVQTVHRKQTLELYTTDSCMHV